MRRRSLLIFAFFCTALLLTVLLSACSDDGYTKGVRYRIESEHARVTGYEGSDREVVIAPTYRGKPVTHLDSIAFRECEDIESVILPDSVTEIGYSCFDGCISLKDIQLPSGLKSIRDSAFWRCSSLETISIPETVESIGNAAFEYCSALTHIILPESLRSLDDSALPATLSFVILPENLEDIGRQNTENTAYYVTPGSFAEGWANEAGFDYLYGKPESDALPERKSDGVIYRAMGDHAEVTGCDDDCVEAVVSDTYLGLPVTRIEDQAFWNSKKLEAVELPEGLEVIGEGAFKYCTSLKSVRIPDSVQELPKYVFEACSALTQVELPAKITFIPEGAFWGCSALEAIEIPNAVTEIREKAFYSCSALKSITIPDSVTTIGNGAFGWCESLCSIRLPENIENFGLKVFTFLNSPEIIESFRNSDSDMICTLYEGVTDGRLSAIPTMAVINSGSVRIENLSEKTLIVLIPAGTYFESANQSVQNMLMTNPNCVIIGAGNTETIGCAPACMNLHRGVPTGDVRYTVGETEDGSALQKLVEVIHEQNISTYAVYQAAVWILTDDASFNDTQILQMTSGGSRSSVISKDDYAKAQELVCEAYFRQMLDMLDEEERDALMDSKDEVMDEIREEYGLYR